MCNHINKQYVNKDGQLEDLKCELPDGHAGDHQAPYTCLRIVDGMKDPRNSTVIQNGREYYVVEETAYWGDAAGRTVFEIAGEQAEKHRQLEEFKALNPGMNDAHKAKARELGLIPSVRA